VHSTSENNDNTAHDNTAHGASPADPYSALEFTLEHHQAALTLKDHVRAAELRHVPRTPGTGRLRVDLHEPGTTRPDQAHWDLGTSWARDPRHRTGRNGRHPRETPDDPPF